MEIGFAVGKYDVTTEKYLNQGEPNSSLLISIIFYHLTSQKLYIWDNVGLHRESRYGNCDDLWDDFWYSASSMTPVQVETNGYS